MDIVASRKHSRVLAAVVPVVLPTPPSPPLPTRPMRYDPTPRMSELEIHDFLSDLSASLDSMTEGLAFRECREAFTREFFQTTTDSGLKIALAGFLYRRFGTQLPLWGAIYNRTPDVLSLI